MRNFSEGPFGKTFAECNWGSAKNLILVVSVDESLAYGSVLMLLAALGCNSTALGVCWFVICICLIYFHCCRSSCSTFHLAIEFRRWLLPWCPVHPRFACCILKQSPFIGLLQGSSTLSVGSSFINPNAFHLEFCSHHMHLACILIKLNLRQR